MSDRQLPEGWAMCQVRDLGRVVSGGTPSTKIADYWGDDHAWICPSDLTGYKAKYISGGAKSLSDKGLKCSSAKMMPAGSIHFSSRAPIGYVAISSKSVSTNQGFKSIVPFSGLDKEYGYYYLKSIKNIAEERATGTTFKELSGSAFAVLPFPLPPLNEQKRIVAKIEELFSELDAGVENLRRARAQLGVYRQALLKQAFEGKLTERWRAENPDKIESTEALLERIRRERDARLQQLDDWKTAVKEWDANGQSGKKPAKPREPKPVEPLTVPELAELPVSPEGWVILRVAELLTDSPSNGRSVKDRIGGFRVLRLNALREGRIDLSQVKEGDWNATEAAPFLIRDGDFLISRGNGSKKLVARGGIVRNPDMIAFPDTMVRLPLEPNVVCAEFFSRIWNSDVFRQQIEASARTTAGIYKVNQSLVSAYKFPLCSLPEQREIVRILDEQFSAIEQNEREIDAAMERAEALRQSILKKAFSGDLVPQDPNDEPASVLLERIRAEREVAITRSKKASVKRKVRS